MPLLKRILYDASEYHNVEVFREATSTSPRTSSDHIDNRNMSSVIGVLGQLSALSTVSLEIFHSLALLSEDVHDRVKLLSLRTNTLISKLPAVEKKVNSINLDPSLIVTNDRSVYLKNREMLTPSLFIKKTNFVSITQQYKCCKPLPQLWRIETYMRNDEDLFRKYSYPGFFFQEWLQTEVLNQQQRHLENKANKALKKQAKSERRKLREIANLESLKNNHDGDDEHDSQNDEDDEETKKRNKLKKHFSAVFSKKEHSKDIKTDDKLRQNSKDVTSDDNASLVNIDRNGEDSSTNGDKIKKHKKFKPTKAVGKLANVFGFTTNKSNSAIVKTDGEEDESEDDVLHDNETNNKNNKNKLKVNEKLDKKASSQDVHHNGTLKSELKTEIKKTSAMSALFNNFTNRDTESNPTAAMNVNNVSTQQITTTQPPTDKLTRRPSMTMENMSLSLLTNKFGNTSLANMNNNNSSNNNMSNRKSNDNEYDDNDSILNAPINAPAPTKRPSTSLVQPPLITRPKIRMSAYTTATSAAVMEEADDSMFKFSGVQQQHKSVKGVMKIGNNKVLTATPKMKQQPRPSSVRNTPDFEVWKGGKTKGSGPHQSPAPSVTSTHSTNLKTRERLSNVSETSSNSSKRSNKKSNKKDKNSTFSKLDIDREKSVLDDLDEEMESNASVDESVSVAATSTTTSSITNKGKKGVDNNKKGLQSHAEEDEPEDEPSFDEDEEEPPEIDEPSIDDENDNDDDDEPGPEEDVYEDDDEPVSERNSQQSAVPPPPSTNNRGSVPPPPPPGPPAAGGRSPPPPPPPPNMLIKKAPPPPPPAPPKVVVDETRMNLLSSIRTVSGIVGLQAAKSDSQTKSIDQQIQESKKIKVAAVKQNECVAAILANRSKIAGSDSESDDSDSDYTDDGY